MKQYDHAFTVAFSVQINADKIEDISPTVLRQAIIDRANELYSNDEFVEALGAPFDTVNNFADYPITEWQTAVSNGETTLGYCEWAASKCQAPS